MPLYEFEHAVRLATSQKHAIAKAITNWHASTFKAPRFIVACRFIDVSQGVLSNTYIGGQERKLNRLFVSLRSGTGRAPEQLDGMTRSLLSIWNDKVGVSPDKELRAVYIKGKLDSAFEGGFMLPMPGNFEQWVKDNTETFKELASNGDEDLMGLVEEIRTRTEFQK